MKQHVAYKCSRSLTYVRENLATQKTSSTSIMDLHFTKADDESGEKIQKIQGCRLSMRALTSQKNSSSRRIGMIFNINKISCLVALTSKGCSSQQATSVVYLNENLDTNVKSRKSPKTELRFQIRSLYGVVA